MITFNLNINSKVEFKVKTKFMFEVKFKIKLDFRFNFKNKIKFTLHSVQDPNSRPTPLLNSLAISPSFWKCSDNDVLGGLYEYFYGFWDFLELICKKHLRLPFNICGGYYVLIKLCCCSSLILVDTYFESGWGNRVVLLYIILFLMWGRGKFCVFTQHFLTLPFERNECRKEFSNASINTTTFGLGLHSISAFIFAPILMFP